MPLEQPRHRDRRPDAHLLRRAPGHGEALEGAQRRDARPLRRRLRHEHAGAGAVRQLRRVARGNGGGRVLLGPDRRQRRQRLQGGARPVALVLDDGVRNLGHLARFLILEHHHRLHRHNLVVEQSRLLRRRRPLLRPKGILVLPGAGDAVALGHQVGRVDHGHPERRHRLDQLLLDHHALDHLGLNQGDGVEATANGNGRAVDHDRVGRHRDGLKAARAEAVDGLTGDSDRAVGPHRRVPRDVHAGLAFWHSAAHDDILDQARINVGLLERSRDGVTAERGAVGRVEPATEGLGEPRARRGDNDSTHHWDLVR
mmetsp:Transcript_36202/g.116254  ORF Transcript_36202/g.116254 Transcript_36202/m.116254 type:complete len:313 (+) Transcript_36202:717-1655(+)